MIQKHPLLKSTAILTCAGMVSRIIGFFYRIFLSKTIGAEGIGIYLLLFPIQTLLFSLTSSGIQTAISRFVSARLASNDKKGARDILLCGMMLSVLFSGIASFFFIRMRILLPSLCRMRHAALPSENFKLYTAFCRCACLHHRILYRAEKSRRPCHLPAGRTDRPRCLFVPVLADHGGKRNPGNPCACHVWYADLGDHRGSVYRNPVSAPPSVFF